MTPAPLHKLARLRKIAGLSQSALAKLINRSVHTVQAIEQNKLKIGKDLADRISAETAVSRDWLLDENQRSPIVDRDLQGYSRVTFDELRDSIQEVGAPKTRAEMKTAATEIFSDILDTMFVAMKNGNGTKALADFSWNRDVLMNAYGNGVESRSKKRRAK